MTYVGGRIEQQQWKNTAGVQTNAEVCALLRLRCAGGCYETDKSLPRTMLPDDIFDNTVSVNVRNRIALNKISTL